MDVENYNYRRLDDTLLYCYHVAGVVGVMMAYVMGVKDNDALLRAADKTVQTVPLTAGW